MVEIYSVGSAIQPMNNPGQTVMVTSKARGISCPQMVISSAKEKQ